MRTVLAWLVITAVAVPACSAGDGDEDGGRTDLVVTTSILGDVVRELVGDAADVEVLMPPGADPHDFSPSARQAAALRDADAVVVNGAGFEEGLLDAIDAAAGDGTPVVTAIDGVETLPFGDGSGDDPHFFTDPARMRAAAAHVAGELERLVPALANPDVQATTAAYLAELDALDGEVGSDLEAIAPEDRLLVTNHDVFGYFADRYGFEVVGVVIPGGSTLAEPSASDLADLAEVIDERGVPAVFADTSSPDRLADALAREGAQVEVVELYSESLGPEGSGAESYLGMVRTNAQRIAAALG